MRASTTPHDLPGLLFISSYPPRECGIATYTADLITALNRQFRPSFTIRVCPVVNEPAETATHPVLDLSRNDAFSKLATRIRNDPQIHVVCLQHEFGLYEGHEAALEAFLTDVGKPVVVECHTVLAEPSEGRRLHMVNVVRLAAATIVLTRRSSDLLCQVYGADPKRVTVIPHGTHPVSPIDRGAVKERHGWARRTILTTFGLLGPGKSLETTVEALPAIVAEHPSVLFLVIGKTHPGVLRTEGETYRERLEARVAELHMDPHVTFVNRFVPLPDLLEYLQITDLYVFTSKDPQQTVSGTFAYALSCGCPIVSTPIPHVREVWGDQTDLTFDFGNSDQLARVVNKLLADPDRMEQQGRIGLHIMAPTIWANSALAHARVYEGVHTGIRLTYTVPPMDMTHIRRMTTETGIVQFARLNQPDLDTGYTLDDNARAMVATCHHFALTGDPEDLAHIRTYLRFIRYCAQPDGSFLNYVDRNLQFTSQNQDVNLDDAQGRAIWALGYLNALQAPVPDEFRAEAADLIDHFRPNMTRIHSTRAMAFLIKGLCYRNQVDPSRLQTVFIRMWADRLVQMYRHEAKPDWDWMEGTLTYGNPVIPEALLCAWRETGSITYQQIALASFRFLIGKTFDGDRLQLISNRSWLSHGDNLNLLPIGGGQPIDVAYTVLALQRFHEAFPLDGFDRLLDRAFEWFLGRNHLGQVIYNARTGGCRDGLEDTNVNPNEGAESTVSYGMARMAVETNVRSAFARCETLCLSSGGISAKVRVSPSGMNTGS